MIVIVPGMVDVHALARLKVRDEDVADDGADWSGRTVLKPWGHERQVHRDAGCALWRLSIAPGAETSLHCHPNKHTMLVVERGEVILHTLAGKHGLGEGFSALILPGAFHRTFSAMGATVCEVEWPPVKRDLVRLEDRYGRAGMGMERAAG